MYCWYLKMNSDEKVLCVEKREGVFFDSYEFNEPSGVYIPKHIKRQVKRALAECPAWHRYFITYDEAGANTIVGIDKITLNDFATFVPQELHADDFWKFLAEHRPGLFWPISAQGQWVFNSIKENLDAGILRYTDETTVYNAKEDTLYYLLAV